jgi:CheY-like chemotaxis protein
MVKHLQPLKVLVVDSEPIMRAAVAESLDSLRDRYVVELASSSIEALAKVRRAPYAVVLAEHEMPVMNGLGLAKAVRELSPETRVVLMAASGSATLRQSAAQEGLDGYIEKPFTINQIQRAVQRAVETGSPGESVPLTRSPAELSSSAPGSALISATGDEPEDAEVRQVLEQLAANTRARCVLLVRSDGGAVDAAGHTRGLHLPTLSALIAATYAATVELSRQLGNSSIFRASHHQGLESNIYTCEVSDDLLLAVVFGRESLAGAVWLFAREAAAGLGTIFAHRSTGPAVEGDLASAIDAELEHLFDIPM